MAQDFMAMMRMPTYLWKIYDEQGIEVADQPYNDNWIEEAEDYLAKQKKRLPWVYE